MLLSIHQNCFDLRDERKHTEREIPAPELEELEPDAMAMGVCVGGYGGSGASRRPR
jgi:hypothetical protein